MYAEEIEKIKEDYSIQDIFIIETPLSLDKSCSCKFGEASFIGIDTEQVTSIAELRSLILHEAGHCREDAFYCSDDTKALRRHAEYLAIRWAIRNCIPFDKYIDAIRDGVRDVYQLAEYFDVTVESAEKAIDYYNSRLIDYLNLAKVRGQAL